MSYLRKIYNNVLPTQDAINNLVQPIVKMTIDESLNPLRGKYIKVWDTQMGTFKPDQKITFKFPDTGLVDVTSLKLGFVLQPNVQFAVSSTAAFTYDISTIFSNVRVKHSQTVLEDIDEYGFLTQKLGLMYDDPIKSDPERAIEGKHPFINTPTGITQAGVTRQIYHSRTASNALPLINLPRSYLIDINCGLLQQSKYLPLDTLHGELSLELTLQQPKYCMIISSPTPSFAADPTYSVSKAYLLYKSYDMDTMFKEQYSEMLRRNRLTFQFVSWNHSRFNMNELQMQQFTIPTNKKYLKYAMAFIRNELDVALNLTDPTATYCNLYPGFNFTGSSLSNDRVTMIKSYQYRIGETRYPEERVQCYLTQPRTSSVTGPSSNASDITDQFASPATEQYYYYQQLGSILGKTVASAMQYSEYGMVALDYFSTGTSILPQLTQPSSIRNPFLFPLIGIFSSTLPDGRLIGPSPGCGNNDPLVLSIEFNGRAINGSGQSVTQPMYLDVFTCYDNYWTVTDSGDSMLDC